MSTKVFHRSQTMPNIQLDKPIIKKHYYPPSKLDEINEEKPRNVKAPGKQVSSRHTCVGGTTLPSGPGHKTDINIQKNDDNTESHKSETRRSTQPVLKIGVESVGSYEYENKFFKYEGQWRNGKKHGQGKLIFIDNSFYEGTFKNGEIEGFGTRYFANTGCRYQGQFVRGEMHGKGRMIWPDGSVYEGTWYHNRKQGFGVMKSVQENMIYKGLYFNNKRSGQGTMIYPQGDRYDGEWQEDMRHGDGDMKYMDGTVYEGQFEDDIFNGEGTMRHCSGVVYHGHWKNGNPTILPSKLVISSPTATGKQPVEFIQGQPFSITVQCVNDNGDVIEEDSGRELKITAGFKHIKAKKGTALFDLIEEYEEKPMQTPFYDVLQYPLTDFIQEEEQLEEEPDKEDPEKEEETKQEPGEDGGLEEKNNQPDEDAGQVEDSAADEAQVDPASTGDSTAEPGEQASSTNPQTDTTPDNQADTLDSSMVRSDSMVSEIPNSVTPGSMVDQPINYEKETRPLPPPVVNKRSENGVCEWQNIQLAQPPPRFPPFVALDEEERKVRARQNKQVEAKRFLRMAHDDRYARIGEYVIIVQDVTNPPFMGQSLEPAYLLVKLKKPKKEKKAKEVKPKKKMWDTSKHIADSMVRT